jgi:hypothetical protein
LGKSKIVGITCPIVKAVKTGRIGQVFAGLAGNDGITELGFRGPA